MILQSVWVNSMAHPGKGMLARTKLCAFDMLAISSNSFFAENSPSYIMTSDNEDP